MTPQERRLWYNYLSGYEVRFYKQRIIGPYIVDFYCSRAAVVIELDGSQHYENEVIVADMERDRYLSEQGLHVMRFTNSQVDREFAAVCDEINRIVTARMAE